MKKKKNFSIGKKILELKLKSQNVDEKKGKAGKTVWISN